MTTSDSETKDVGYTFFLAKDGGAPTPFTISLAGKDPAADPCGWDPLDEDVLFADDLGLTCFLRSCALPSTLETGDEVTSWPDESGSGNDMTDVSSTPVPVFDGAAVLFDRSAAAIQCQKAYSFHAEEWTWFFTVRLSALAGSLALQVFSALVSLAPRPDRTLGFFWSDYCDEAVAASRSGSWSEAETGVPITDWLSRVVLCVRARVVDGVWYSSLRLNGHTVREGGVSPYSDSRRDVSLSWRPAAAGQTMSLRHALGFDRYLDDAACAAVETILNKYAEAV